MACRSHNAWSSRSDTLIMFPSKTSRFSTAFTTTLMFTLSMLLPALSEAAALGDEVILSQLGDPVEIEIAVMQWEDIDLEQVQVSAGTPEVYESFGLDYLPELETLRFNVVGPSLDGEVKVLVSSREPMNEPYMQLLLVMRWPGGSLLREYVLLFDPPRTSQTNPVTAPVFTTTPQVAVTPAPAPTLPQPDVQKTPQTSPPPEQKPAAASNVNDTANTEPPQAQISIANPTPVSDTVQQIEEVQETVEVPVAQEVTDIIEPETSIGAVEETVSSSEDDDALAVRQASTYTVKSGDNLWGIATNNGPVGANANLYQILLSLYELNRGSFINGNISLLKYGVTLRLPTAADVAGIDPETAQSLFDQRWNEGSQRISMAQRGEALPPLSSIFAPEVVRPEINPTAAFQDTEEPQSDANNGGLLISSSDLFAPAATTGPSISPLPGPGAVVSPDQVANPVVSLVSGIDADGGPALGTATGITVTSTNPYVEGVNASMRSMQDTLAARQQQVEMLETQMDEMSIRMLEISRVTERLNSSLETALAERDRQQASNSRSTLLLGGLVLGLSAALIVIIVMVLKLAAQIRVQHQLLQRSIKTQPAIVARSNSFTDRPGQTKSPHAAERIAPAKGNLTAEQALSIPIIEDMAVEQCTSDNTIDTGQNSETFAPHNEPDVLLGDMEIDTPEEKRTDPR